MCENIGIEFDQKMMEWTKLLDTNWEGHEWNHFYKRVQEAKGFEVTGGIGATDHSKALPDFIYKEVAHCDPSYQKLYKLRTPIIN